MEEADGPKNLQAALAFYPYASVFLYSLWLARIIIHLGSLKWPRLLKLYYFIELLLLVTYAFIPANVPFAMEQQLRLQENTIVFSGCFFFNFWVAMPCTVLSFMPMYVMRVYLYGEEAGPVVFNALISMPWHILNMFFINWIVTKVGYIYIEAVVLRSGNEQVLDSLEEGVVILEESSKEILYYNAAAIG